MSWVMVPVPEEMAPQIEGFLMAITLRERTPPWDPAHIRAHRSSLSPAARALLDTVVAVALEDRTIDEPALARLFDVDVDRVFELTCEVNEVQQDPSPPVLVEARPARSSSGGWVRTLSMPRHLAEQVQLATTSADP